IPKMMRSLCKNCWNSRSFVQEILDAVEDPEMILDLFTCAMGIQEKYEAVPNPSISTQAPRSGVKEKDESDVSHGRDVNEHRPGKESNLE
ncbi:hypothetical protein KI387_039907, partial [Taxus chinensis]